jgi:hypothetical protein
MSKINKLNSGIILSANAKEFTQKKIILNISGKDYEVLVDEKFKPTKLQQMIIEGITNQKYLTDVDDAVKLAYYTFLIVKHFTDVDVAKVESFEEQIRVLNAMIDLEIFQTIVDAFPVSEIEKCSEFVKKFVERVEEFAKENKSLNEVIDLVKEEVKEEVS